MQVKVNKKVFQEELKLVQGSISSKTTIPVLTGVLITVKDSSLNLTGGNGDTVIERRMSDMVTENELTIKETGAIVVPAKLFGEIVKKLPEDIVELKLINDTQLQIKSGKAKFKINAIGADSYPRLNEPSDENSFDMDAEMFMDLINKTAFAASKQESRPILTGVNLISENGTLTAYATDSHRMSKKSVEFDKLKDFNIVFPATSLNLLSKLLNEDHLVSISIEDNRIFVKGESMTFFSRLLDGNFPDMSRLIPTGANTELTFSVKDLLATLDRATLFSDCGHTSNVVKLTIRKDEIKITGNSPEVGNIEEFLENASFEGDELEISFNPKYLKDSLKVLDSEKATFKLISSIRPFVIEGEEDVNLVQLITPIRTV